MFLIGVLLILLGVVCFISSSFGFGDIGLLCIFMGIGFALSGIGFVVASKKLKGSSDK